MTTLASEKTSFDPPAKPEPLTHRGGSPPQRSGTPEDFIDYVPHPHDAKFFQNAPHADPTLPHTPKSKIGTIQ